MSQVRIKFVSRKLNKVRWQPRSNSVFLTGSYDDEENKVSVWKFPDVNITNGDMDINMVDDDPSAVATLSISGDVTDLKVISEDLCFVATSLGSIYMLNYSDESIKSTHIWKKAHSFSPTTTASCTGLSIKGHNIASVGEDGNLCVTDYNQLQNIHNIESPDQCSLTCIAHIRYQEIVTGNSLGFLRMWDLRNPDKVSSTLLALNHSGVSCLASHPTQPHIVASGHDDGCLRLWDMRNSAESMAALKGHTAPVTEVLFHPTTPRLLYTASMEGAVWQWDSAGLQKGSGYAAPAQEVGDVGKGNPWQICDATKHKLDITALNHTPWTCINTLDIASSTLLWANDNEELCMLGNVAI